MWPNFIHLCLFNRSVFTLGRPHFIPHFTTDPSLSAPSALLPRSSSSSPSSTRSAFYRVTIVPLPECALDSVRLLKRSTKLSPSLAPSDSPSVPPNASPSDQSPSASPRTTPSADPLTSQFSPSYELLISTNKSDLPRHS